MTPSREGLARAGRGRLRYRPEPAWIGPMLATLSDAPPPPAGGWIYEPKLDGVRVLVFVKDGRVRLFSRNRKPLDGAYPELVEALEYAVRGDAVLDGEVVAIDPKRGVSSFALLQQRMQLRDPVRAGRSGVPVILYLFDCLYYEGIDLTGLPLVDRKSVLRDVVWYDDPIRFTPFKTTGSAAMYRGACAKGAEGIIAKRADSRYVSARSTDWLKIKCVNQQEFVIGGYTEPQGSRERLGALLVGWYEGETLRYAGKVGTGYDRATLELLHRKLVPLQRRTSPFAPGPLPAGAHWVTP
ncbi:MAG TPA: non-homologous end-joining DNA ligase, partial [Gemmatimonadales bacterium]|nr:non-homologous end-joining DNA ligase [Gemmatimonadales bacterium]